MVPGEVILWPLFDLNTRGGPPKDRYLIILGKTGLYSCPAFVFVVTPTTCLEHYTANGDRAGRKVVWFEPGPGCPFPTTCLVDVEYDRIDIDSRDFESAASVVAPCGRISDRKIIEIWKIIETSRRFPDKIRDNIRDCLAQAGVIRK